MLNDPPRPVLPKSTRIKRGGTKRKSEGNVKREDVGFRTNEISEELVTDALEFKKLYKDLEELGKG
jgi:hypothetical protein